MRVGLCSVEECGQGRRVRGMCIKHYYAALRKREIDTVQHVRPVLPLSDRLKRHSKSNADTGCIEWTGFRDYKGYGVIGVDRRAERAHRVAWEIKNGKIPNGMNALHKCDNRSCINPDHLFLGTQIENIADMDAKGRRSSVKGEEAYNAKLTEEKVRQIRRDPRALRAIARAYGVDQALIARVKKRTSWKHVV